MSHGNDRQELEARYRALEQRCQELEARSRSLDALNRLAATLLHFHADVDDILWDVANGTVAHLGLEDCVIYLMNEERTHLVQRAAYGPKNPREREILDPLLIPVGRGIVGTVAATGRPELIPDTREDPRYIRDDRMRLSELAVPLFFQDQVIGVLDSEHSQEGFFTGDHLGLLTTLASMTAARIGQSLLDEQLRDVRRVTTAIIESALDAIITVDGRGRVVAFNHAAQAIFGCAVADALFQPLSRFVSGGGAEVFSGLRELTGLRGDGSPFPVEASVSRIPGRREELTTLILRDISERLRAQQEIHQLNQGLELRIAERTQELSEANRQSERLLLNVLPQRIAERLKRGERFIAERFESVTVLFADLVGFTRWAAAIPPEQAVAFLGRVFTAFDALTARHGLEKIKTIGDAYMVVAGVPTSRAGHCEIMARMALEMLEVVERMKVEEGGGLDVRIGLHSGPVVAGIIGTQKFAYDLWGDTVNTASRLEAHGVPGRIHVTESTWLALREHFDFEFRGEVEIKSLGRLKTWLLMGER